MAMAPNTGGAGGGPVKTMGGSGDLAELVSVILDKGIVIDAWARVSVIGLEVLTIEARVVVASVDTYLRYAEAIGLTQLSARPAGEQDTGRQRDGQQERQQPPRELPPPTQEEVADYLSQHPEGLRLGEMEAVFDTPRPELERVANRLVEEGRARRDEEHALYFAE